MFWKIIHILAILCISAHIILLWYVFVTHENRLAYIEAELYETQVIDITEEQFYELTK